MAEIIVPILTPFNEKGEIDGEKVKTHVQNLLRKGVDIIFVNGTTGVGPALSKDEKRKMLDYVLDVTNKVIFQVGSLNMKEVLELVNYANERDMIAVASYPPYYFSIPKDFVVKYFKEICEASKHPVYLYNYPGATGKDVDVNLAKEIGCIKGVKDTNPDFAHTIRYKELGIKTYNGLENLAIASLSVLDGTVVGAGNYMPELFSQLREYIKSGDMRKALDLQLKIDKIDGTTIPYGKISSMYYLVKELQGYDVGVPRPPMYPLEENKVKELIEKVRKIWNKSE